MVHDLVEVDCDSSIRKVLVVARVVDELRHFIQPELQKLDERPQTVEKSQQSSTQLRSWHE